MSYNPNQPMVPAGKGTGGQRTSDGSGAASAARQSAGLKAGELKPKGQGTLGERAARAYKHGAWVDSPKGKVEIKPGAEEMSFLAVYPDGKTTYKFRSMADLFRRWGLKKSDIHLNDEEER